MNEPVWKRKTLISALLSYGIGYLWISCFAMGFTDASYHRYLQQGIDWYPVFFTVCFLAWGIFTVAPERKLTGESIFWMACTVIIAICMALGRCRAVEGWSFLALHGFAAYWIVCSGAVLIEGETSGFLPLDLLTTFVILPFGHFFLRLLTILQAGLKFLTSLGKKEKQSEHAGKSFGVSLLIVLAAIPVFLLAARLLGEADDLFYSLWLQIQDFFTIAWQQPDWVNEFLGRCLLGLPVGAFLFGLAGGAARKRAPYWNGEKTRAHLEKLRIGPEKTLILVCTAFIVLYFAFFAVQAKELWSAFWSRIPGAMTASQYARDGFFGLLKVMVINFALMAAISFLSRTPIRSHRTLQILGTILMVQSVFLAISAASKLWLYIHRFGFTPLRLQSMWAILVLVAGCVLATVSLYEEKKTMQKWVWFAAATFTLLCCY